MGALALVVVVLAMVVAGGARAAQLDPELLELARAVREDCAAETGVAEALLAQVDGGAALPPEPALKCYVKCTMETAGMLDEGRVDEEAVLALLPDDLRANIEPAVRACGTKPGADDCDTAYRTQLCWQQTDPDAYIFI